MWNFNLRINPTWSVLFIFVGFFFFLAAIAPLPSDKFQTILLLDLLHTFDDLRGGFFWSRFIFGFIALIAINAAILFSSLSFRDKISASLWTSFLLFIIIAPITFVYYLDSQRETPQPPKSSPPPKFSVSYGEEILLDYEAKNCKGQDKFKAWKREGVEAYRKREFEDAITHFGDALKQCKNAPETRIYFYNSKISLKEENERIKPIPIAVSGPITEPGIEIEEEKGQRIYQMLQGFSQAQSDAFDKGIYLKLWIVDDKDEYDENKINPIAQSIVDNREIVSVIGHWNANTSIAAAKIYNKNLVFIAPISITEKLSSEEFNDFIFLMNSQSQDGADALADHLEEKQIKSMVVFNDPKNEYSKEITEKLEEELRNVVPNPKRIDLSSPKIGEEWDKEFPAAIEKNSVLVFLPSAQTMDAAIKLIVKNNRELCVYGDMANLIREKTLNTKEAVGMILPISWSMDKFQSTSFAKEASTLWGGQIGFGAAMSYNSLLTIHQAATIIQEKSGSVDRLKIKNTLKDRSFKVINSASGKDFRFDVNSVRTPSAAFLVQILDKIPEKRQEIKQEIKDLPSIKQGVNFYSLDKDIYRLDEGKC